MTSTINKETDRSGYDGIKPDTSIMVVRWNHRMNNETNKNSDSGKKKNGFFFWICAYYDISYDEDMENNLNSRGVALVNPEKAKGLLKIVAFTNLYIPNIFLIINFIDKFYALQSCCSYMFNHNTIQVIS